MKLNTKDGKKKLGPETAALIRATHGMASKIAALGRFDHSYVSRVRAGRKPPSLRFLKALDGALRDLRAGIAIEIVRHEHPEITGAARR
jgi:hypothetical protein